MHPALHRTWIPMSEAIDNPGTICPVRIIGRRETRDADVTYVRGVNDFAIWEVYGERVRCWMDVFHGGPCHHED